MALRLLRRTASTNLETRFQRAFPSDERLIANAYRHSNNSNASLIPIQSSGKSLLVHFEPGRTGRYRSKLPCDVMASCVNVFITCRATDFRYMLLLENHLPEESHQAGASYATDACGTRVFRLTDHSLIVDSGIGCSLLVQAKYMEDEHFARSMVYFGYSGSQACLGDPFGSVTSEEACDQLLARKSRHLSSVDDSRFVAAACQEMLWNEKRKATDGFAIA